SARLGLALCLGASFALAACSSKAPEPTPSATSDAADKPKPAAAQAAPSAPPRPREERLGAASAAAESAVKAALRWDDPPAWVRRPPSNQMRIAEYSVPKRGKDPEDAEMVVNTFASGPGNTVDANIDRWVRQFDPQANAEAVSKKSREVNGLKVHTVSLNGTYKGMMMPGSASAKPKEGYRLVGAVVEAPNGLWFFKMTGPEATVKGAEPEFEKLVGSLRKADDAPGGSKP
ncbi:MAG TPA: hypothetical protein VFS00_07205, partial [Polyangiaceae bacterium]|nr:hypothetical protein [Polyangiaceae bacterium]